MTATRRHTTLFLAVSLAAALLVTVALAVAGRGPTHLPVAVQTRDAVVPDGVALDVRGFGARGDGTTDDTDALQAAISAGIGTQIGTRGNPRRVLYLPAGTYLVTRPLEWRRADGAWATGLTLQGQNRDRTVIQLADRATGFQNAGAPQPVIRTASRDAQPDGSGNQAFGNFLFDLTISVGADNPGADGLDYLANNRGSVRDVALRAAPGSGRAGVSMTRRWPGPCLFENVSVNGFTHGVVVSRSEYSVTFDGLRLTGQRVSGIDLSDNVATVRGLTATGIGGPVVRNQRGAYASGLFTIIDSELSGTSPQFPAIDNETNAYVLRVRAEGFATTVRDRGRPVRLTAADEWSSSGVIGAAAGGPPPERGPDFPPGPAVPPDRWAGADTFGAVPDDQGDDSGAIQRALDSGDPVVYLRPGLYVVGAPLIVPPTVEEIVGFDASLDTKRGGLGRTPGAAVLRVRDGSTNPLVVSHLAFDSPPSVVDVERPGSRPLHLRDIHHGGVPFRGGPGEIFLTDVEGGRGWTFEPGQRVWARQLNPEAPVPAKIRNNGARLWILGLKTESGGSVVVSDSGADTQVVGGLLYPLQGVPPEVPAFSADRSSLRLTFAVSAAETSRSYATLVSDDGRPVLRGADAVRRGAGVVVPSYRGS